MVVVLLVTLARISASTEEFCIVKKLKILFLTFFYQSRKQLLGVFYRPPNQAEFMVLMVKKFSHLNLKDNEIYLLGDFNINLFQNGKYILNGKRSTTSQGPVHTTINRCRKFCQIHSLKQLITCFTRLTCNTSTLIDHILTNSTEKVFQSSVIDSDIHDHQLIFCTSKVKRVKFLKHNNGLLRSLKHYTVNSFIEGL